MAIKFLNDINADSGVLYVDTSNDRVGIGTASPGVKLQVGDGSTDDRIRSYFSDGEYTEITGYGINFSRTFAQITPTTDAAQALYIGDNSFSWGYLFTDAATHQFGHNADVFMVINPTGNVGIGTTNPSKKLDVRGEVALDVMPSFQQAGAIRIGRSDGTSRYHEIVAYNDSTTENNYLRFDVHNGTVGSNTGVLTLRGNGGIQFPQYGAGILKTDANGNVSLDTSTYSTFSGDYDDLTNKPTLGTAASSAATDFVAVTGDTMTGGLNIEVSTSNTQLKLKRTTSATGEFNIYTNTDSLFFQNVGQATYPMMINSSGNVGIGTTSPGTNARLVVAGSGVDIESSTDSLRLRFYEGTTFRSGIQHILNIGEMISGSAVGDLAIRANAGNMLFATGGSTERMRIDDSGNVGIGTASPTAALHVDIPGNTVAFRATRNGGADGDLELSFGSAIASYNSKAGAHRWLESSSEKMRLTGGNLGIGTTSPDRKLHVIGSEWNNTSGGGVIFENSNTVGASLTLKPSASVVTNGANGWAVYAGGPGAAIGDGNLGFWSHGTNEARMVIQRGGNVGIGTTSPSAKLHISHDSVNQFYIERTGSITGKFRIGVAGANNRFYITDIAQSEDRLIINESGDLQLPAYTAGLLVTDANGNVSASTDYHTQDTADDRYVLEAGDTMTGDLTMKASEVKFTDSSNNIRLQLGNITGSSPYEALINTQNYHLVLQAVGTGQNDIKFRTGTSSGADRMIINEAGNVGIGTTSTWTKLVLDGDPQAGTPNAGVVLAFDGGSYAEHGYRFKANGANYYQVLYDGSAINWKNYAGGASYTTRMSLTNAGNVGIGTTLPNALLDVNKSTIGEYAYFGSGSTRQLRLSSYNTVSDHAGHKINASSGNGEITLATNSVAAVTVKNDQTVQLNAYTAGYVKSDANGNLTVDNSTFLQQEVDTLASVTSRGAATSQVTYFNGTVNIGASVGMTFSSSAEGATYMPTESTVGTSRFFLRFDTTDDASFPYLTNRTPSGAVVIKTGTAVGGAENEHFRIKGGDGTVDAYFTDVNLGIGTTSPSKTLSINSPDSSWDVANWKVNNGKQGTLYADTAGVGFYVGTSAFSTYVGSYFSESEKAWDVRTNGAVRIKINSSGNVGIGTTSPSEKLHIGSGTVPAATLDGVLLTLGAGQYYQASDGTKSVFMGVDSSSYGIVGMLTNHPLGFRTDNTERMRILANGNVGIGTTSPTQSKLVVDGDISVPRGNALVFLESITGGFRAKITSQNTFPIFNGLEFYTGGVGTAPKMIISDSGNLQLLSYGAGILKTDANGNVSLDTSTYIPTTDYDDFVNVGGDTMTGNLLLEDSVELRLGTDTDLKIYHDGTTGRIANNTGHLYIQNLSDDKDIYLRSDDGAGGLSTYLSIDGSDGLVNITKPLTLSNYGAGILKTDASGVVSVDTSTYLTSYTETQTLDDVTDLGNSTTNSISVGAITLTDDPASSNGTFVKVYEDTHKRMYTANLNFSFTAAGTYNFNLVFPNGGGYHYDLIAVNSRNGLYRNFGTLKDSSYIYWESDQDFTHRAEGDIHLISSLNGGMYFSADTTYFLSDDVTDSVQTGSANWSYAIVRYSVYIPYYAGDTTGSWKLHLTTYGDTGSNVPQFVLA